MDNQQVSGGQGVGDWLEDDKLKAENDSDRLTETEIEEIKGHLADMSEDEMLDFFVEMLVAQKGVSEGVSEEVLKEHRANLKTKVQIAIGAEILKAVPEDKKKEVERLLLGEESDELMELLDEMKIEIDKLTEKAMDGVRKAYLGESEEK